MLETIFGANFFPYSPLPTPYSPAPKGGHNLVRLGTLLDLLGIDEHPEYHRFFDSNLEDFLIQSRNKP
ncbi:MAG: hypothetical protein AB4206_10255 [Xenococcaceae cyanobacterium]